MRSAHQASRAVELELLPQELAAVFVGKIKQTPDIEDNLRFEAGLREARVFYVTELGLETPTLDPPNKAKKC
jgi:hypothetical protein